MQTRLNVGMPHASAPAADARRMLGKGAVLHLAGDPGGRVYVVESGAIKFVGRDEDGRETIVGLALPGDCVGDVAAADGGGQPFDAVALVATSLVTLRAADATPFIMRSLARRVRLLAAAVHERGSGTVAARLAARLLELAPDGELPVPIPQSDLGGLTGASRESICKELRRLRAAGAVAYRGRRLRILRPDLLERLRCGRVSLPEGRDATPSRSTGEGARRRSQSTRGI